jgi:hypothetical protein
MTNDDEPADEQDAPIRIEQKLIMQKRKCEIREDSGSKRASAEMGNEIEKGGVRLVYKVNRLCELASN